MRLKPILFCGLILTALGAIAVAQTAPATAGAPAARGGPAAAPTPDEIVKINAALKALLSSADPGAKSVFDKYATYNPIAAPIAAAAGRGGPATAAPKSITPRDDQPFTAANYDSLKPNIPTLVIAGDSTADASSDAWHRGWAAMLMDYFDLNKINVVNLARGGRSSRSFLHEGLWDKLLAGLKPGDIVVLQFGHNDGGDITNPNGRADLKGTGDESQAVTLANGTTEEVHTFSWYTRKFITDVRAKGATPIVLAATPYNRWVNGKFVHKSGDFADDAKKVAEEEKVPFIDHTAIISDRYDQLGPDVVNPFFIADGVLHTNTFGGIVNAEMFISGVKAAGIKPLVDTLNDKGQAIPAYKPAAAAAATQ